MNTMDIDVVAQLPSDANGAALLAMELTCPDATGFCYHHMEEIYHFWATLSQARNVIAKHELGWEGHAVNIFRQIDSYILGKESIPKLQRVGYISLAFLMDDIKREIAIDRRCGRIVSKRGQRDASLALDLYLAAQGSVPNPQRAKKHLYRRLKISRCWRAFSKRGSLLSVVCGEKAERIM